MNWELTRQIAFWWLMAMLVAYGGFYWACRARARAECRENGHQWRAKESGALYCWNCMTEVE